MKKIALVTGASRGIGAETAKQLAENGYAVCINYYLQQEKAEKLVSDIKKNGGEAICVRADLSKEEDILHLFKTIDQTMGSLSALVNNAGIDGGASLVEEITADRLKDVFSLNVFGTFICCREALKRMKETGGSIVNVSSEAARFGGTHLSHYAASKAAVNAFTIGFAREAANYRVRVNAVSPGVIGTDMHASSQGNVSILNSLPMKRMGTAKEVAELITWLLSDAASYVSGSIIPITGAR